MVGTNDQIRAAARSALEAHDALKASRIVEPKCDEDGVPIDPDAWQRWYHTMHESAYARWSEAMDNLATALDNPKMSRHPFNFRPLCERILGGEEVAAMQEP